MDIVRQKPGKLVRLHVEQFLTGTSLFQSTPMLLIPSHVFGIVRRDIDILLLRLVSISLEQGAAWTYGIRRYHHMRKA